MFALKDYITSEDIKNLRKNLGLTQKEFASLVGTSKPTIERWEKENAKITGPIVLLSKMINDYPDYVNRLIIPEKEFPVRMFYMYKDDICTLIDVDDAKQLVRIKNYTDKLMFRAFGVNEDPDYNDYKEFLESRCFPRTRDKMKLVLEDIGLPFYNGFYWCTEIRKTSNVPILFLSSMSDNMNIVMAIQMGGDDFVTKPFDLNVLTVKIQALLRRTYAFQGSASVMEHKGLMLNLSDASVTFQNRKIELTKNDYKILQILMERAGTIVKREEIMQRLWESDEFIDDNTLTVNMTRLRKKLEELGVQEFIKTKKGIGYIIE